MDITKILRCHLLHIIISSLKMHIIDTLEFFYTINLALIHYRIIKLIQYQMYSSKIEIGTWIPDYELQFTNLQLLKSSTNRYLFLLALLKFEKQFSTFLTRICSCNCVIAEQLFFLVILITTSLSHKSQLFPGNYHYFSITIIV